ncbi:HtaA domain-containing protein, partial [Streptomyces sparsus]
SDSGGSDSGGSGGGPDSGGSDPGGSTACSHSGGTSTTGTTGTGGSTGGSGGSDSGAERPAASGKIVDGTLDWGVKKSFRSYVTGPIGGGTVETGSGAEVNGGGYRFPDGTGSFDAEAPALETAFKGSVRFLAHKEGGAYALDLKLSELRVTAGGGKGSLVADVSSKDRESGKVSTYDDLTLATLTLSGKTLGGQGAKKGVVTLTDVPAALTTAGAKAFGGFYRSGEALDPVSVAISLDKDATLPSGTSGGSTTGGSGGADAGTTGAGTTGSSGAGT